MKIASAAALLIGAAILVPTAASAACSTCTIQSKKPGKDGKPCLVDQVMTDLGAKHDFQVTCTKDGRIFLPETLKEFDAFFFITTGDLTKERDKKGTQNTDDSPPMPPEGKKALLGSGVERRRHYGPE